MRIRGLPGSRVHERSYSGTGTALSGVTWDGVDSNDNVVADGTYRIVLRLKDGGNNLRTSVLTVIVDSAPPIIDQVLPVGGGNSAAGAQPILATVLDGDGSEVSTLAATVTDQSTGALVGSFSGAQISYDPTTGQMRTPAVNLIAGRRYDVWVRAVDLAGNEAVYGPTSGTEGFLAVSATPQATTASIPRTTCQVSSQVDLSTGMKNVTCPNVPLHLDPATVTLSGTAHEGRGYVRHTASLSTGVFTYEVGLGQRVSWQAYNPASTAWSPRTTYLRFDVDEPSTAQRSYLTASKELNLGTLTGQVPVTWDRADLEMPAAATTSPQLPICADPSTGSQPCGPDPVVVYVVQHTSEGRLVLSTDGTGGILRAVEATSQVFDNNHNVALTESVPLPTTAPVTDESGPTKCHNSGSTNGNAELGRWSEVVLDGQHYREYLFKAYQKKGAQAGPGFAWDHYYVCGAGTAVGDSGNVFDWRTKETGLSFTLLDPEQDFSGEHYHRWRGPRFIRKNEQCDEQGAAFNICRITLGGKVAGKVASLTGEVDIRIGGNVFRGGPGPSPRLKNPAMRRWYMGNGGWSLWQASCPPGLWFWLNNNCGSRDAVGQILNQMYEIPDDEFFTDVADAACRDPRGAGFTAICFPYETFWQGNHSISLALSSSDEDPRFE